MKRFKPIGPRGKALAALLAGRVGDHRVLTVDATPGGVYAALEVPTQPAPMHGLYIRSDWSEAVVYYRFYIKGVAFERRMRNVACGNFGVLWVRLGGRSYQLDTWGAPWPG